MKNLKKMSKFGQNVKVRFKNVKKGLKNVKTG